LLQSEIVPSRATAVVTEMSTDQLIRMILQFDFLSVAATLL